MVMETGPQLLLLLAHIGSNYPLREMRSANGKTVIEKRLGLPQMWLLCDLAGTIGHGHAEIPPLSRTWEVERESGICVSFILNNIRTSETHLHHDMIRQMA